MGLPEERGSKSMRLNVIRRSNSSSSAENRLDASIVIKGQRLQQELEHTSPRCTSNPFSSFFSALTRKKPLDCRTDTSLNRCLNLLDLTALGVGSTLGLGLYVLAGQVASNKAGPAVVISFALAALASAFSALCYAEFAGRVPRAGSAYAYSYITVGEFVAFVIGWNLILEYVIGAASVARGFSGYLCFVYDHVQSLLALNHHLPSSEQSRPILSTTSLAIGLINNGSFSPLAPTSVSWYDSIVSYLVKYFDWPSVAIIVVITIFVLLGVKGSTNVTLAFTSLNLLVVGVMIISSINSLDLHNWRLSKTEVPLGYGEGGFLPYGWSGVLAGSATCFFGFIGFDTIASSAEEAKNPKRNVPLAILLSLLISFITYISVAIVQTLLWPYYDQNKVTILPYVFERLDMPITYWIVLLGAIAGLASSQLGGMYPLPRILYSMAHDRLIYGYLAHINKRLKLPVRATIVGSLFVAILSCLLDIEDLADMVSIGTLAAYSLVSLSVLILRYEDRADTVDDNNHLTIDDITLDVQPTLEEQIRFQTSNAKISDMESGMKLTTTKESINQYDGNDTQKGLGAKTSTTINEKESCFGSPIELMSSTCKQQGIDSKRSQGQLHSLLDLLITWKADDQVKHREPDKESSHQSKILISVLVALTILLDIIVLCLTSMANKSDISSSAQTRTTLANNQQPFSIHPKLLLGSTGCIVAIVLAAVMLMLARLPTRRTTQIDVFQVPLVPLVPTLSILVNTFLMLNLSYLTWLRFTVWMAIGLFIYFTYGIWKSRGFMLYLDRLR